MNRRDENEDDLDDDIDARDAFEDDLNERRERDDLDARDELDERRERDEFEDELDDIDEERLRFEMEEDLRTLKLEYDKDLVYDENILNELLSSFFTKYKIEKVVNFIAKEMGSTNNFFNCYRGAIYGKKFEEYSENGEDCEYINIEILGGHYQNREILRTYLYYGYLPQLLAENERKEKFTWEYFLWKKNDDPYKNHIAPDNIVLTKENLTRYRKWNLYQLRTYVYNEIMPGLINEFGLNLNIHHKVYKNIIYNIHNFNKELEIFIKHHDINKIKKYVDIYEESFIYDRQLKTLIKYKEELIDDGMDSNYIMQYITKHINHLPRQRLSHRDNGIYKMFAEIILRLKLMQLYIKEQLNDKFKRIVNRDNNDNKLRYKWQKLCSSKKLKNNLELEELQELAYMDKIPYYLFLSKRELCAELSKRFSSIIEGRNKVVSKCQNESTIIGEDLKDIPAEFFYSYEFNGKIWCDDIRGLHKHLEINGNKHPSFNAQLSRGLVNNINKWYEYLEKTMLTMEDFDEDFQPVISQGSLLTMKLTTLMEKLNYPNSQTLYVNSTEQKFNEFVDLLVVEEILNNSEKRQLEGFTDLSRKKLLLVEILTLKIQNDPQQIIVPGQRNPLSAIAINLSNIYNDVYNQN